jgi:hypothetical protein
MQATETVTVQNHSMVLFGYNIDTMGIVFMLMVGMIVLFIYHAHKYQDRFNVYDLIMENGHASKTGVVFMLAFVISSWVLVYETLSDKLSEWMLLAWLGAWVGPIMASIIKGGNGKPPYIETPAKPPASSNPTPDETLPKKEGE